MGRLHAQDSTHQHNKLDASSNNVEDTLGEPGLVTAPPNEKITTTNQLVELRSNLETLSKVGTKVVIAECCRWLQKHRPNVAKVHILGFDVVRRNPNLNSFVSLQSR